VAVLVGLLVIVGEDVGFDVGEEVGEDELDVPLPVGLEVLVLDEELPVFVPEVELLVVLLADDEEDELDVLQPTGKKEVPSALVTETQSKVHWALPAVALSW